MQDHDFTSRSNSGKPYYYVFIKGDTPVGQAESRFFRFDTAPEAAALYRFLEADQPELDFSLGVHRDYTRRADIIERIGDANVLSDSVGATSPWKDDPSVAKDAADLALRLGATWKLDRELVGRPILVPNEREWSVEPPFLQGKALRPDVPEDPKSSIREASVRGLGWMSLEALGSLARCYDGGSFRKPPMVGELLVDYRGIGGKGCGSVAMTPGDYRLLEKRHLALQQGRDAAQPAPPDRPLDDLKQEAKARTRSHLRPLGKPSRAFDHAL